MRRFLLHFIGYDCVCQWEGIVKVHSSWSERDALAWAACYPRGSVVHIERKLTGYIHAARRA